MTPATLFAVVLVAMVAIGSELIWNAEAYMMLDHDPIETSEPAKPEADANVNVKTFRLWTNMLANSPKKPIVRCLGPSTIPIPCQRLRKIPPNDYRAWTLG